jgi:hypothetical protein
MAGGIERARADLQLLVDIDREEPTLASVDGARVDSAVL